MTSLRATRVRESTTARRQLVDPPAVDVARAIRKAIAEAITQLDQPPVLSPVKETRPE